jgi:AcrR family transcriptional regulator
MFSDVRSGSEASDPVRRRRRTPEEAEAEIVTAAEALLRERPFRELTVDEVMRRTDLSRPSFYVYFRDRHHLVLKVVERIGSDLFQLADTWYKGGKDGPSEIREAMGAIARAWAVHGPVLRALSDAAREDPGVQEVYDGLIRSFVDASVEQIKREQEAGHALPLDVEQSTKALMWMSERYLLECLAIPDGIDPDLVAETISTIWIRTIYGPDA